MDFEAPPHFTESRINGIKEWFFEAVREASLQD